MRLMLKTAPNVSFTDLATMDGTKRFVLSKAVCVRDIKKRVRDLGKNAATV